MTNYRAPTLSDGEAGYPPDRETQRIVLLKSLEYLYIEACYAKMALVATLIGAAVEAVRDEIGGMGDGARAADAALAASIRNVSANRLLTDDDEFDDEDYFKG